MTPKIERFLEERRYPTPFLVVDLERVAVGDEAPNFTLESFSGEPVELAGYRGEKNVVLVFYRGHW